jgi:ribonuclease H / adenosylcobalamin/alpha-ribazole phosphatase
LEPTLPGAVEARGTIRPNNNPTVPSSAVNATLILIRHAAHADLGRRLTGRASGVQLTPAGERQTAGLAERLGARLDAVQTSPRERARRTAEAIATRTGAALEVVEALDEIDFGDWTGMSFDALEGRPDWRRWNEARGSACPPNGESMAAAQARVAAHADAIARTRPGAEVALVSHSDILRALVAHYLGLPLDNLLRFEIDPASISRIEVGAWGGRVLGLNEAAERAAGG